MTPLSPTRCDARRAVSPAGDSAPKTPIPGRAILSKLAAILRQAITPTPDAYERFQASYRARKASARRAHGRLREIEAEQRAVIHAALGVKR